MNTQYLLIDTLNFASNLCQPWFGLGSSNFWTFNILGIKKPWALDCICVIPIYIHKIYYYSVYKDKLLIFFQTIRVKRETFNFRINYTNFTTDGEDERCTILIKIVRSLLEPKYGFLEVSDDVSNSTRGIIMFSACKYNLIDMFKGVYTVHVYTSHNIIVLVSIKNFDFEQQQI